MAEVRGRRAAKKGRSGEEKQRRPKDRQKTREGAPGKGEGSGRESWGGRRVSASSRRSGRGTGMEARWEEGGGNPRRDAGQKTGGFPQPLLVGAWQHNCDPPQTLRSDPPP